MIIPIINNNIDRSFQTYNIFHPQNIQHSKFQFTRDHSFNRAWAAFRALARMVSTWSSKFLIFSRASRSSASSRWFSATKWSCQISYERRIIRKSVGFTLLSVVCERAGVLTSAAVTGVGEGNVEKVLFISGIDIAAGWGAAAGVGAEALNVLVGWMV